MNALIKALDEIKYTIPFEVLRVVFRNTTDWRSAPTSLDSEILNKVIRPRVLLDCNLVGGQSIMVNLGDIPYQYNDAYSIVYRIPAERLLYRSLISVLSVGYLPFLPGHGGGYGNSIGAANAFAMNNFNDVSMAAQRVADSFSSMPSVSTAQAEIIADNTVLIRDTNRVTNAYQLRCIIGNEENLNNINPRSYISFTKLCQLAVKSYIYNNMIIKMDSAFLSGGQELGAFKNYVENLADSEEMYRTELTEVWQKVAFMNDQVNHTRFLKSMLSPGI